MTNELRKMLGRNMRFAQMNNDIDNQIKQLQVQAPYNTAAQMQINALQQQFEANKRQMAQPMSESEYADYDDYGQHIGNQASQTAPLNQQQNSSAGQPLTDGIGHAAQGVSLGWSDELMGVIGGTGQLMGNAIWRATGHSTNGETLADAWRNGYQEYRDFARQKLQDGYERHPIISG